MKSFHRVLVNTAIANVTTGFLWFALTFWIYLETRSVLATGVIGGAYMGLVALCSLFFGVVVDHTRKKSVMALSSLNTVSAYLVGERSGSRSPTRGSCASTRPRSGCSCC